MIKLENLNCTKLKRWLQWGETDRVWESRLATHCARPPPAHWMTLLLLCVMIFASDIWGRDRAAPAYSPLGQTSLSPLNSGCQRRSPDTRDDTFLCEILHVCLTACVSKDAVGRNECYPFGGRRPPFVRVIRPSCYVIPSVMTENLSFTRLPMAPLLLFSASSAPTRRGVSEVMQPLILPPSIWSVVAPGL